MGDDQEQEFPYEPFQELMLGDDDELHQAIAAAEVLMLGFEIRKEAVVLKNEEDRPAELAVHFRMTLFRDPLVVPAQEVPR